MKHQWAAYLIVVVLSAGAGIAVAGLPDDESVDPRIVTPSTESIAPSTSTPPETSTTTASPPESGDGQAGTATEVIPEPTTPSTTADGINAASAANVVVVNGSTIPGLASGTSARLEAAGFEGVESIEAASPADFSVLYFASAFEPTAIEIAEALNIDPVLRGPLSDAPPVAGIADRDVVVYLGLERTDP